MAYIHKATVYFIDPNEEFETVEDIAEEMDNYDSLLHMKVSKAETKTFDWDDNVIVNRIDCTGEQAEIFFQNVPEKTLPTYYPFRVTLSLKNGVESVHLIDKTKYSDFTYFTIPDSLGNVLDFYKIDVEATSSDEAADLARDMFWKKIKEENYNKLKELQENIFKK